MVLTKNSMIRIPLTYAHKLWLLLLVLLVAGSVSAAWILDDNQYLLGILVSIIPGLVVGSWIGRSPGKIEFLSDQSYFVRSRNESFPWIYNGDNWEKQFVPTSFHLQLNNSWLRWSGERLEIITPRRSIFLGSGEKMLPIRDWLLRHGLNPK